MIRRVNDVFLISTRHTDYLFWKMDTGHLEHLYYGPSLGYGEDTPDEVIEQDARAMCEKRVFEKGNIISYDQDAHRALNLEDTRLEVSTYGKGDIREPFAVVRHADGSFTSDFLFRDTRIKQGGGMESDQLPHAYSEKGDVQILTVILKDRSYPVTMELYYAVFEESDVITRGARIINDGEEPVHVERLMSVQLDLERDGLALTMFRGAWVREMNRVTAPVTAKVVNASYTGTSSSRANPFVMLHEKDATEQAGRCYAFNLIYSGNHYEAAEVNGYRKTRFVAGINPESFCWVLGPGESLEAPEAVMAVSDGGFRGISCIMQHFVREHIVRGEWKYKERPILLNSWEAAYFKVDEDKIIRLARDAKKAGVELIVLDDGWFGNRTDDFRALGDWDVDKRKFPYGLSGLCSKINALGMDLGLWVEPEMINTDSDLYRAHPDWAMDIPDKPHSEGRNQRLLDLSNGEVVDALIKKMTEVFSSCNLKYVKWDMNRIFSDIYSRALPAEKQGEVVHRYQLGFYRMARTLTQRFPQILFEGCASGGNRFDLGMLCYFPQIWASDDTDAMCRVRIQEGYSYGYPMSAVAAHVSACPNHQTLRVTPLSTRFNVAAFGVLGYEVNLQDLSREERDDVAMQIVLYKKWRSVLQFGTFYRIKEGNEHQWICVSPDKKRAVGLLLQEMVMPNYQYANFRGAGLDPELRYRFLNIPEEIDIRLFGSLINTQLPVNIRQRSFMHNAIAQFYRMDGEREDHTVSGSTLMNAGVSLQPGFSATGFNGDVRFYQDFSSRLYFMTAIEE